MVSGFDANHNPRLFTHLFRTNEHLDQTGTDPATYAVLGTNDAVRELGEATIENFLFNSQLRCEAWAKHVVSTASAMLPVDIGFPLKLTLTRRGVPTQVKMLNGPTDQRGSEWTMSLTA